MTGCEECTKYATEPLIRRIKALEKALKENAACETCTGKSECEKNGKALTCTLVAFDAQAWEFDLARFVEKEVETVLVLIRDNTFSIETQFCNNCSTEIDEDHYFIVGHEIKCSCCGVVLGIIPEV
jgi:hypothetical protein